MDAGNEASHGRPPVNGRTSLIVMLAVVAAGCAVTPAPDPMPPTDIRHLDGRAVERHPLPDSPSPSATPTASSTPFVPSDPPAIVIPPHTLYVCVLDVGEIRKQTAIEFAPKVGAICARHPEMGPCQYERNACRRGGGRVYAAGGAEITMETEAEYDKKVLRVRFSGG